MTKEVGKGLGSGSILQSPPHWNSTGHCWGHVQVIKPPKLLEISGPLFLSFPCVNHVQFKFLADGIGTKLTLTHCGFGDVPDEFLSRIGIGWAL